MEVNEVKSLLEAKFSDCHVEVQGDGRHFEVLVVGDVFEGLSAVKRQQLVYAQINDEIASGRIHAVNIKTHTQVEWQSKNTNS